MNLHFSQKPPFLQDTTNTAKPFLGFLGREGEPSQAILTPGFAKDCSCLGSQHVLCRKPCIPLIVPPYCETEQAQMVGQI